MNRNRRNFLRDSALATVGFVGLSKFADRAAAQGYRSEATGYGPLIPDPEGILDLPEGFTYQALSRTGDRMEDGLRLPGKPDGMAAFEGENGEVVLVRNHELSHTQVLEGPYGGQREGMDRVAAADIYDPRDGRDPHIGGTTNLVWDPVSGAVRRQFLSLTGTARNCAGGPTPWKTWITCEETMERAGDGNQKDHGYNFEVAANAQPGLSRPIPLKAMGRFNHEAVAVDPKTSIVYQTEDRHDGLIYRFIPNQKGKLAAGGKLQALVLRTKERADTRNWSANALEAEMRTAPAGVVPTSPLPMAPMQDFEVAWVDLDDVEAPDDDLRYRGRAAGAAVFARGEGMWRADDGSIFFACTNGGPIHSGQVFRYTPSPAEGTAEEGADPGTLRLFVESTDVELLQYCDNLTVAPWGDLVLAEDGADQQYLRGVTPEGELFTLAKNRYNLSEFAGVCFDPKGQTLFVNIQTPGITLAISGPWQAS